MIAFYRKSKKTAHFKKGFTLVELLVVISIIGLLASIVLASVVGARQNAIDAKVISERVEIQKSLDAYNAEFGGYPNDGSGSSEPYCIGGGCEIAGQTIPAINEIFAMRAQNFAVNTKSTTTVSKNTASAIGSFEFPALTDLPEFTIDGLTYKGFIYMDCNSTDPTCLEGSGAKLITTTYKDGLSEYAVGTWGGSQSANYHTNMYFQYASATNFPGSELGNGWDGNNKYYSNDRGGYQYLGGGNDCITIDTYGGVGYGPNSGTYCSDQIGGGPHGGCTNSSASNYDSSATYDDGSCTGIPHGGCMNSAAPNYDVTATYDDGSCQSTGGGGGINLDRNSFPYAFNSDTGENCTYANGTSATGWNGTAYYCNGSTAYHYFGGSGTGASTYGTGPDGTGSYYSSPYFGGI